VQLLELEKYTAARRGVVSAASADVNVQLSAPPPDADHEDGIASEELIQREVRQVHLDHLAHVMC
jgi:hypothetical protein